LHCIVKPDAPEPGQVIVLEADRHDNFPWHETYSMRSRPGWVDPKVYFRIVHLAQGGHSGAPVATYREQTVEIALGAQGGITRALSPYMLITNRMLLVQFQQFGRIKNLLMEPTGFELGQATPFFKRLADCYGDLVSRHVLSTRHGTVRDHLLKLCWRN
jgi:hypothetical protein